jgi:hypothetical protein
MPAWRDIDPVAIASHLHIVWSWTYDRSTDSFTGRLAGEEINDIFGRSLRKQKMQDFFAGWNYDEMFQRYRRAVTAPCIALGTGSVFIHMHKQGIGERLIMPLAADGITGDGVLGATVYNLTPAGTAEMRSACDERMQYFQL